MVPTMILAIVLICWSSFHLLHNFILNNSAWGPAVDEVMQRYNIFVTPFHVRWFTQRWNQYFIKYSRWRWLKTWFNIGVLFSAISMIVSTVLLTQTLINSIKDLSYFRKKSSPVQSQVLTVMVPGINLPIDDIGYLLIAVLLSAILHEMGHAIAATREGIKVNGFGIFLFAIYPGAYVDLSSNELNRASASKQLRVYCAGVWHNFIICVVSCILILSLPLIVTPFYAVSQNGVVVTDIKHNSPLYGYKGLNKGDIISRINDCSIRDSAKWFYCVNSTSILPQKGSCTSLDQVEELNFNEEQWTNEEIYTEKKRDCCGANPPSTHLCYKFIQSNKMKFACLPGRVMASHKDCETNKDCLIENAICTTPYLDGNMKFVRLEKYNQNSMETKESVLYLGPPIDILRYVAISEYIPRLRIFPLRFPEILLRFIQYMFSMSGALALINIVPCHALDGQWAFQSFLAYFFAKNNENLQKIHQITKVVLTCGTMLVSLNVVFGFVHVLT